MANKRSILTSVLILTFITDSIQFWNLNYDLKFLSDNIQNNNNQDNNEDNNIIISTNSNKTAPSWPDGFNSTLAKIAPDREGIVWVKHYYDWSKRGQRFDFYNDYVTYPEADWKLNCSILFVNTSIWFIFPEEKACKFRSGVIPPVNPNWVKLLNATYNGTRNFRGIKAELWQMEDPDDPNHIMDYYARADDNRIPLRSPNQINDPGATDFFDTEVGPQNQEYFNVPDYCYT